MDGAFGCCVFFNYILGMGDDRVEGRIFKNSCFFVLFSCSSLRICLLWVHLRELFIVRVGGARVGNFRIKVFFLIVEECLMHRTRERMENLRLIWWRSENGGTAFHR